MTKSDLAAFYGSYAKAARALGRTRSAVSQWNEQLPINLQYEIEGRTRGKLKADRPKIRIA